ncbi:MAG: cupin domain-containing protein [Candidatus Fermentibacteria bacterium]
MDGVGGIIINLRTGEVKLALIRKAGSIRTERESRQGYRNVISRVLAGPAQGCDDLTVRLLTIKPEGRVPRTEFGFQRVITVLQGELLFMDGDGAMHQVGEGDVVIIRPWERHHFQNDSASLARIHIVESR